MTNNKIIAFYQKSKPADCLFEGDEASQNRYLKKLQWSSFLAGTIGYSLYYVCRTSLNVIKKPILDSGLLNAQQLGIVGSVLLFSYAIGKFANGFLADYSNIKRFMATGLAVSAVANLLVALLGFSFHSLVLLGTMSFFITFCVLWAINGWCQSMGAAPAIIALSRWFPISTRGTFYGLFSASHNLGEFLSFIFVGSLVGLSGWQFGFMGAAVAGLIGVVVITLFLHDTPESKGLPPIEQLAGEVQTQTVDIDTKETQKQVLRNPYVWILALASSFMYISRYAINGWGVLLLQEQKGFSLESATQIVSINALLGIIGTVFSGWMSDKIFHGNRHMPALLFGMLNTVALCLFLYSGNGLFINILSMSLFGIAIGVLICFLGGLMAVDIVPRSATGATLGIVGIASYIGAGLQDIISGILIEGNKIAVMVNGTVTNRYDFTHVGIFWIGASIVSFLLATLTWKAKRTK